MSNKLSSPEEFSENFSFLEDPVKQLWNNIEVQIFLFCIEAWLHHSICICHGCFDNWSVLMDIIFMHYTNISWQHAKFLLNITKGCHKLVKCSKTVYCWYVELISWMDVLSDTSFTVKMLFEGCQINCPLRKENVLIFNYV